MSNFKYVLSKAEILEYQEIKRLSQTAYNGYDWVLNILNIPDNSRGISAAEFSELAGKSKRSVLDFLKKFSIKPIHSVVVKSAVTPFYSITELKKLAREIEYLKNRGLPVLERTRSQASLGRNIGSRHANARSK